jgi:ABC-type transport system substrate-binding protein
VSSRIRRIAWALALLAAASATSVAAADMSKTLRVAFPVAETGFDPQAAGDIYSDDVIREIFDALYQYDYLARPYKVVPNTAVAMPEISADGKTWTIKVKPGIYFADDPAFKGRKRELVAADYVYSLKRVLDPAMRSNSLSMFDGLFVGAEAARKGDKFDYDVPIEGLQAIDRYTIRLKLTHADYELLANLTTTASCAAAREVVEAYRDGAGWVMANPVGTGPYVLKEWRRGQKIVLEANPGYRDVRYPTSRDPADHSIVEKLGGKKLPLVGRIEVGIIEEAQPRLLSFERGDLDIVAVPNDLVWNVLDPPDKLKPRLAQKGIVLARGVQPAISYLYFNMEDPVVGGYTPDKIALRRALSMAYNVDEEIRVLRQGQGMPATQPIPPGVSGYNAKLANRTPYDPAAAKALLDRFGYKDRDGDGWRELPDGAPFVLKIASAPSAINRQYDELQQRSYAAVGVKVEFIKQKWPDLLKASRLGQLQMWALGNINVTPEGLGFMGLLYGPYSGFSNLARFKLAEYDRLYDQARAMPDSPERAKLLAQMSELVATYAPWNLQTFRIENVLVQPWVVGYKYNPFYQHPWRYYDIDVERRRGPM